MLAGKRKSTKVTNGRWQIFIFYICLNSAAAAAPICHSFFNSLCCVYMCMCVCACVCFLFSSLSLPLYGSFAVAFLWQRLALCAT